MGEGTYIYKELPVLISNKTNVPLLATIRFVANRYTPYLFCILYHSGCAIVLQK